MHGFDTYISGIKLAKRAVYDKNENAIKDNDCITFMCLNLYLSLLYLYGFFSICVNWQYTQYKFKQQKRIPFIKL